MADPPSGLSWPVDAHDHRGKQKPAAAWGNASKPAVSGRFCLAIPRRAPSVIGLPRHVSPYQASATGTWSVPRSAREAPLAILAPRDPNCAGDAAWAPSAARRRPAPSLHSIPCLLYTSDAADEEDSV